MGELSDHEVGATLVTKVNLQKRKQLGLNLQYATSQKAALRASIFAPHGASTLEKKQTLTNMRKQTQQT